MIPEFNNVKYNKLTQMTKAAVPLTTIWVPCLNVEMPSAVCFVWIRKKRYGFLWGKKTDFLGIFIWGWNGHLTNTHIYQFSSYYHLSVLYTHSTKSQQQLPKAPCVSAAISDDDEKTVKGWISCTGAMTSSRYLLISAQWKSFSPNLKQKLVGCSDHHGEILTHQQFQYSPLVLLSDSS